MIDFELARMTFPVFILEIDDHGHPYDIYVAWSESDSRSLLEPTDVEYAKFTGWDASGRPIKIFVAYGEVRIAPIEAPPQLEKLKSTIVKFANEVRTDCLFEDQHPNSSVAELWGRAREHMKGMGFWKKFLGRF